MARQIVQDILSWKKEENSITSYREIVTGQNSVNRLALVLKQFCVSVWNSVDSSSDWYSVSNVCYIGLKLCRIIVIVNQSSDVLKGNLELQQFKSDVQDLLQSMIEHVVIKVQKKDETLGRKKVVAEID